MKTTKLNFAKIASSFIAAFVVALLPFAGASATTNVWVGTTDVAFGTTTNWSTGAVPLDGDSIVFDSTNTTTAYLATASLTNATGNAFAGLTAQGTTSTYQFTINALKVSANAILSSTAPTTNKVIVTALTAQGNVTLDGVTATSITVQNGGTVTLKNLTTLPTSITGAGNIILQNDGVVTPANITSYHQVANSTVTLSGTTAASTLTLISDSLATNYSLILSGNAILTLPANTTITTPITMSGNPGGQIKMSAAGTTTLSTLSIASTASAQYVLPATAYLYATSYTVTSPGTFTAGFGNAGTFTGTATAGTTTTTTTGTGSTTTTTTTPSTPNTAISFLIANPFIIAGATIAIVAAGFGIMKFRKQQ